MTSLFSTLLAPVLVLWIGAASLELTDADLEEIAAAIERSGAGEGPKRP